MSIFLVNEDICTGCSACSNNCPKNAISMLPKGSMGHNIPIIDVDLCVECKLCEKVCPGLNPIAFRTAPFAYASWAKDEVENRTSTSGGIASVMARNVITRGGVVYGCLLDGVNVCHVRIDSISDVDKLKGSKYVQSTLDGVIRLLKADVHEKRLVLFIGTPCQVAGVKKSIDKKYDNLLTVDLICHGTPSLHFLREHVSTIVDIKDVKTLKFRDQQDYVFQIVNKEGRVVKKSSYWQVRYGDAYLYAFMNGYSCRDSCFSCKYAKPERCSDVTIGDFWGLGRDEAFDYKKDNFGLSVVLPNTESGLDWVSSMDDKLFLYPRKIEEAVNGNDQLRSPKKVSIRGRIFRLLYMNGLSIKVSLLISDFLFIPFFWIKEKIKGTR